MQLAEQFARCYPPEVLARVSRPDLKTYRNRPTEYCRDVLRVELTDNQSAILNHLLLPPYKVLVPSGHNTGKTFVAAAALNWWYDTRDPGVILTTAPTLRDVVDLLWTEVRLQRQRAGLPMNFVGDRAPEMRTGEQHYAKGFTARKGESFQGRHRPSMLFVFDEANGVDPIYWTTLKTMFDPEQGHAALVIFNPTETTSAAYQEDQGIGDNPAAPSWHRFRLSALEHPNVVAALEGRKPTIPGAVSLAQVNEWVRDWTEPVQEEDRTITDVEWPPGSGNWVKPGPIFQARAMGCWPDTGSGVWSDSLFAAVTSPLTLDYPKDQLPQIGVDCSQGKGDDWFALHGRWGCVSLLHATSNTMDAVRIAGKVKDACDQLIKLVNSRRDPKAKPLEATQILTAIDDDGTGGAVGAILRRWGYRCVQVSAGSSANRPDRYPRKRDELWFATAEKAKAGMVNLSKLDRPTLRRLRQQLTAPEWDTDLAGRRQVERKDETKEKIGRSPDDADAMNLSYADVAMGSTSMHEVRQERPEFSTLGRGRDSR